MHQSHSHTCRSRRFTIELYLREDKQWHGYAMVASASR